MKKLIAAMLAVLMFVAFEMVVPKSSKAGLGDPWYACYVVSGGTLETCVGPFQDQFSCGAYRFQIPFGARWTGCKQ